MLAAPGAFREASKICIVKASRALSLTIMWPRCAHQHLEARGGPRKPCDQSQFHPKCPALCVQKLGLEKSWRSTQDGYVILPQYAKGDSEAPR